MSSKHYLKITDDGRDAYAEVVENGDDVAVRRLRMPEGDHYEGTPATILLNNMVADYSTEEVAFEETPFEEV